MKLKTKLNQLNFMTMEKVVKSVKYDKPINSQWGEFHKWLLEFEDGFKGDYIGGEHYTDVEFIRCWL